MLWLYFQIEAREPRNSSPHVPHTNKLRAYEDKAEGEFDVGTPSVVLVMVVI
jgi:hypothetical protein